MTYSVDATNDLAPLDTDLAGPYTSQEIRAMKAYYLLQFASQLASIQALLITTSQQINQSGGTMSGALNVPLIPSASTNAVAKQYVDNAISTIITGLSGGNLNASIFVGFRVDSNFNLLMDYGTGTWIESNYTDCAFLPATVSAGIDNNGNIILTF